MTTVHGGASRIRLAAAVCLSSLGLAACSLGSGDGSSPTSSSLTGITTDMGMLVYEPEGRATQLTYGVVLQNHRSDQLARSVRVDVTFVGAAGTAVSSLSRTIPGIPAGEQTAIGEADSAARIGSGDATAAVSMRVSVHVGSWQAQPVGLRSLSVVSSEEGPNEAWTELITFNSNFSGTVWNVTVVAVYTDSQEKILGGSSGCTAEVRPGQNTAETSPIEPIPGATRVRAFVQWKEPSAEGPNDTCE